jgi:3-hydroxyisobutyrate dehydrogenase
MSLNKEHLKVGFVGTGVMGRGMVKNLMKKGYSLSINNRTKTSAEELLNFGAEWIDTVSELALKCDVVITMLGYPKDVEEVYFGEEGLIQNAKAGNILIDMTTSSPILARKIAETANAKGLKALDAPVSGGDIGAKDGKLVIMVGGETNDFEEVKPILEAMGTNIILQGPSGAGQYTKMCNQIAVASGMIGVCEAIAYATKAGLDPARVLDSIAGGAAGSWSLSNLAPRVIAGNFAPGFFVKHFLKDMTIALESAKEMGLITPGLELAKSLYEQLVSEGEENSGTQALYKLYTKE